jgi:hypothetical protein
MATLVNRKFDELSKTGNNGYSLPDPILTKIKMLCSEIGYVDDRQNTYVNQYNANVVTHVKKDAANSGSIGIPSGGGGLANADSTPRKKMGGGDWKAKPTFNVTKFAALDNSQILINEIRSDMNKITEKNVDSKLETMHANIDEIIDSTDGDQDDLKEKMDKLFDVVFNASVTNKLPAIYARVFETIAAKQSTLAEEFIQAKLDNYLKSMEGIVDVSERNYDEFCEFTAKNAARKNISALFCEIAKRGSIAALPLDRIDILFESLLSKVIADIEDKPKQKGADEITENIVVIFVNLGKLLDTSKYMDRLRSLATYKNGEKPGLSSRAKFKFADLVGM